MSDDSQGPVLPIHTRRLTLRAYRPDDVEPFERLYSHPEVALYLLEEPWTREEAEQQIEKRMRRTGLDAETQALAVVIELDGEVIGDIALWVTDSTGKVAEMGWVLALEHGGRGYATEAAAAVLEMCFERYGLHRVAANMDGRNDSSVRVCERLGMRREAYLRQDLWSKGEWTDTIICAVLASDRR